ncbi:hypothetical protein JCM21900_001996 [Sporobolomyces salmonicolor]
MHNPKLRRLNQIDTSPTPAPSTASPLHHTPRNVAESPSLSSATRFPWTGATAHFDSPHPPVPSSSSAPSAWPEDPADAYCASPVSTTDSFSYAQAVAPGTHGLKSRRDTMGNGTAAANGAGSPTITHASSLARRHSPGSSPVGSTASVSTNSAFIGGAFAGGRSSRKGSLSNGTAPVFGRRWRSSRLLLLVVGACVVWWVAGVLKADKEPRKKLMHRWWEAEETSADDLSALLPRPTLPPRPPRPKPPPPPNAHTLPQLLKLPSSLSPSSSSFRANADWTAILHLTSSSQLLSSHLHPVLQSLSSQSPLPPSRIFLLCPSGLEPQPSVLAPFQPLVGTLPYSPSQPPLLALAQAAQGQITTSFLLFVDGHLPATSALGKDYVKTLLHAAGTKEYGAALLSAGGLSLRSSSPASPSSSFSSASCIFPALSSPATASPISVPSTPFLLPLSWLLPRSHTASSSPSQNERPITLTSPTILQGLPLASLPLELALSSALWSKSAIPAYALPIPFGVSVNDGAAVDGWSCERLRRNLEGEDLRGEKALVRGMLSREKGAGEGLRRIKGDRKKGGMAGTANAGTRSSPSEEAMERTRRMREGSFVLLLSGKEELEAARKVACRFAAGADEEVEGGAGDEDGAERPHRELRVVVADYDPAQDHTRDSMGCHLDVTPLGLLPSSSDADADSETANSSASASISLALVDLLETRLSPSPAVVLYLTDGPRAREYEEVLRWLGGHFGAKKGGGGERWSRIRAERELTRGGELGRGRMTVVGMGREELGRAEWMGTLGIEALRHWHTPRIDLSVVTNDRPVSLHRLLSSLQTAHYYGDDVALSLNLEQTTDRLTHRLVDDLRWPHGTLSLRHRILLGGLMPAIVESWYPASNDTYGVLLEDDVEVSPLFYGWLKLAILRYRYTAAGRAASPRLFGISLYQQKNIELRLEGRQPFDAHRLFSALSLHSTTPYLSQIPCSWGAAYFPEHWREFHTYLSLRLSELALPISEPLVPSIRSNRWPRSWKKYFIELAYLRGYSMLYPNYPGFESLSTNHLEKGTHVHTSRVDEKKKALFEVPLLDADASLVDSLPSGQLPAWESLPVLDLWGALASSEELIERGWQTTRMLGSCKALPDLTLPRPRYDARELLCRRMWDRETEGRLVEAQPLRVQVPPSHPEADQGRAEAAKAEQEQAREQEPKQERDQLQETDVVAGAGEAVVDPERPRVPVRRPASDSDDADHDDGGGDSARARLPPARAHHHAHEDVLIHLSEDEQGGRRRGALFDEDEAAGRRRRAVDLAPGAREQRDEEVAQEEEEEEVELGLDEVEQEQEKGHGEQEDDVVTVEAVPTIVGLDLDGTTTAPEGADLRRGTRWERVVE